ncbi:SDR family oxidoreductase [Streptomyces sp. PmtA]|uniref:SDR family NAD(P)-dependent oxidoreductase n=1 Tax=Streptomyces sp. PmtA TaxID=3074275 RepID=UPI0030153134
MTVEEEIAHLVAAVVGEFGGLPGVFNNAGGGNIQGTVRNTEASFWDRVIALNLTCVFYGPKHEIPAIVASGGGSVVSAGDPGCWTPGGAATWRAARKREHDPRQAADRSSRGRGGGRGIPPLAGY